MSSDPAVPAAAPAAAPQQPNASTGSASAAETSNTPSAGHEEPQPIEGASPTRVDPEPAPTGPRYPPGLPIPGHTDAGDTATAAAAAAARADSTGAASDQAPAERRDAQTQTQSADDKPKHPRKPGKRQRLRQARQAQEQAARVAAGAAGGEDVEMRPGPAAAPAAQGGYVRAPRRPKPKDRAPPPQQQAPRQDGDGERPQGRPTAAADEGEDEREQDDGVGDGEAEKKEAEEKKRTGIPARGAIPADDERKTCEIRQGGEGGTTLCKARNCGDFVISKYQACVVVVFTLDGARRVIDRHHLHHAPLDQLHKLDRAVPPDELPFWKNLNPSNQERLRAIWANPTAFFNANVKAAEAARAAAEAAQAAVARPRAAAAATAAAAAPGPRAAAAAAAPGGARAGTPVAPPPPRPAKRARAETLPSPRSESPSPPPRARRRSAPSARPDPDTSSDLAASNCSNWTREGLSSHRVAQLQDALRAVNRPRGGGKAELVERLLAYALEQEQGEQASMEEMADVVDTRKLKRPQADRSPPLAASPPDAPQRKRRSYEHTERDPSQGTDDADRYDADLQRALAASLQQAPRLTDKPVPPQQAGAGPIPRQVRDEGLPRPQVGPSSAAQLRPPSGTPVASAAAAPVASAAAAPLAASAAAAPPPPGGQPAPPPRRDPSPPPQHPPSSPPRPQPSPGRRPSPGRQRTPPRPPSPPPELRRLIDRLATALGGAIPASEDNCHKAAKVLDTLQDQQLEGMMQRDDVLFLLLKAVEAYTFWQLDDTQQVNDLINAIYPADPSADDIARSQQEKQRNVWRDLEIACYHGPHPVRHPDDPRHLPSYPTPEPNIVKDPELADVSYDVAKGCAAELPPSVRGVKIPGNGACLLTSVARQYTGISDLAALDPFVQWLLNAIARLLEQLGRANLAKHHLAANEDPKSGKLMVQSDARIEGQQAGTRTLVFDTWDEFCEEHKQLATRRTDLDLHLVARILKVVVVVFTFGDESGVGVTRFLPPTNDPYPLPLDLATPPNRARPDVETNGCLMVLHSGLHFTDLVTEANVPRARQLLPSGWLDVPLKQDDTLFLAGGEISYSVSGQGQRPDGEQREENELIARIAHETEDDEEEFKRRLRLELLELRRTARARRNTAPPSSPSPPPPPPPGPLPPPRPPSTPSDDGPHADNDQPSPFATAAAPSHPSTSRAAKSTSSDPPRDASSAEEPNQGGTIIAIVGRAHGRSSSSSSSSASPSSSLSPFAPTKKGTPQEEEDAQEEGVSSPPLSPSLLASPKVALPLDGEALALPLDGEQPLPFPLMRAFQASSSGVNPLLLASLPPSLDGVVAAASAPDAASAPRPLGDAAEDPAPDARKSSSWSRASFASGSSFRRQFGNSFSRSRISLSKSNPFLRSANAPASPPPSNVAAPPLAVAIAGPSSSSSSIADRFSFGRKRTPEQRAQEAEKKAEEAEKKAEKTAEKARKRAEKARKRADEERRAMQGVDVK